MVPIFFLLTFLSLSQTQISFWNKHYITYSLENDFHHLETVVDAISDWDIHSLEIQHVEQGKGDIKIYFENLPNGLVGKASLPEGGRIQLNRNEVFNITVAVQHEFGHALGLEHSEDINSIMFPHYHDYQKLLNSDKEKLNQLYKCRYDSVTLLNGYTYIKFKGRNYERIDLNTGYITKNRIWHPSIIKIKTMYRNDTYFIISDNQYFEFDIFMNFLKEGSIQELFPNLYHNISAILTLKYGTIICFLENGYIWYNGIEKYQDLFQVFPTGIIQGAYSDFSRIYLVEKDYMYIYDKDFNFVMQVRMCDNVNLGKIHCCNDYSNL